MWVIYLEMGVALALLILIVWWTWPAKRKGGEPEGESPPRDPHDGDGRQ